MTEINGLIKNSLGEVLDGQLVVTLNDELTDPTTSPGSLHLKEPVVFEVEDGVVDIELLESETQQVSYNFDFQIERDALDGDGNPTTVWESFYSFDAIVPNQPSAEFTELQPTDFTPDQLDSGQFAVARVLATNENYRKNLQFRPSYQGTYSPTAVYKQDDLITYDGSSFIYINRENTLGNAPPDYPNTSNAFWQLVGQRGETGTGTDGNDTPYGVAWNGQTDAPSRNSLYDKIETLAPLDSPQFSGSPLSNTPSTGDISSRIATTQFVANSFAPINSPSFTGSPAANTPSVNSDGNDLATTEFVKAVHNTDYFHVYLDNDIEDTNYSNWLGGKDLIFDTVDFDSANSYDTSTGEITIPTTGIWQFYVTCYLNSADLIRDSYLDFLINDDTTRINRMGLPNTGTDGCPLIILQGSILKSLSIGDTVKTKVFASTPSSAGSSTDIRVRGATNSTYFYGICLVRTN
jgi:hypothetical protein